MSLPPPRWYRIDDSGTRIKKRCVDTLVRAASNGLVKTEFSPFASVDKARYLVPEADETSTFLLRRAKTGMKAITPIFGFEPHVFAHKPIARPEVTHDLYFNIQQYLYSASDDIGSPLVSTALPRAIYQSDAVPISIDGIYR